MYPNKTEWKLIFIIIVTFTSLLMPPVFSRTMCVRPYNSEAVYEMSNEGASIAKLVGQVANQVTRDYLLSFLSSSGHSALVCNQEDLDAMVREYKICVRQVQHRLFCGGEGGACTWVNAL